MCVAAGGKPLVHSPVGDQGVSLVRRSGQVVRVAIDSDITRRQP